MWLKTLGTARYTSVNDSEWSITIENYSALNMEHVSSNESCAFWINIHDEQSIENFRGTSDYNDEELRKHFELMECQLASMLGRIPVQRIIVGAGCNERIDHAILAQLVLHLGERYGSLIDLGRVRPRDSTTDPTELPGSLRRLPGTLHRLYSESSDGRKLVRYLVDPVFLRAWMEHPDFHMVK